MLKFDYTLLCPNCRHEWRDEFVLPSDEPVQCPKCSQPSGRGESGPLLMIDHGVRNPDGSYEKGENKKIEWDWYLDND